MFFKFSIQARMLHYIALVYACYKSITIVFFEISKDVVSSRKRAMECSRNIWLLKQACNVGAFPFGYDLWYFWSSQLLEDSGFGILSLILFLNVLCNNCFVVVHVLSSLSLNFFLYPATCFFGHLSIFFLFLCISLGGSPCQLRLSFSLCSLLSINKFGSLLIKKKTVGCLK